MKKYVEGFRKLVMEMPEEDLKNVAGLEETIT